MYSVKFTTAYKKSYKLMKKRGLDLSLLDTVVDTLRQGKQLDAKYRDHELSGKFKGFRECHIKPDWLLVYLIENDILTLTLVDTGTHSDIFKLSRYGGISNEGYSVLFVFYWTFYPLFPIMNEVLILPEVPVYP